MQTKIYGVADRWGGRLQVLSAEGLLEVLVEGEAMDYSCYLYPSEARDLANALLEYVDRKETPGE